MDEAAKKKHPGGRPRILTAEHKDQIVLWIKDYCVSRNDCAKRLGIDETTIRDEMKREPEFARRVREAEVHMRDQLFTKVVSGADKDYRAAQFLLKSKFWREFAENKGTYTGEDFVSFGLKISDLVKKYVPEGKQQNFADEVRLILTEMKLKREQT